MDESDERDGRLLGRVAAGEVGALGELFDRHSPRVYALLLRILGQPAEAEEVLQEVFLQVWRQAGRYRSEAAPAAGWMSMLARSRAIDYLRSREARGRRHPHVALDEMRDHPGADPVGTRRLEDGERRRQVSSALARLPAEQRECIELAFFAGLTHTQIADRIALPLGTVKSRILLGMRKLRQVLSDEHPAYS